MKRIRYLLTTSLIIIAPVSATLPQPSYTDKEIATIKKINTRIQQETDIAKVESIKNTLTQLHNKHPDKKALSVILAFTDSYRSRLYNTQNKQAGSQISTHLDATNALAPIYSYYNAIRKHDWEAAATLSTTATSTQLQQWYTNTTYINPFNIVYPPATDSNCYSLSACRFYVLHQEQIQGEYTTKVYDVSTSISGSHFTTHSSTLLPPPKRTIHKTIGDFAIVTYTSMHVHHSVLEKNKRIVAILPFNQEHFANADISIHNNLLFILSDLYDQIGIIELSDYTTLLSDIGGYLGKISDNRYHMICTAAGIAYGTPAVYVADSVSGTIELAYMHDTTHATYRENPCDDDGLIKTYDILAHTKNNNNKPPAYTLNILKKRNNKRYVVAQ